MIPRADDPLITSDDVASQFHVARGTVLNWSYGGLLPEPVKVGRRLLWRQSAIDAWAAERSDAQPAAKRSRVVRT
ncbi:helix-turn-helix transcriptional regulator [Cellulomonas sp. P5_E12]